MSSSILFFFFRSRVILCSGHIFTFQTNNIIKNLFILYLGYIILSTIWYLDLVLYRVNILIKDENSKTFRTRKITDEEVLFDNVKHHFTPDGF